MNSTTTTSDSTTNAVVNLMDIDDNHHGNNNNTTNGFTNHGTVSQTSSCSSSSSNTNTTATVTNQISNGHSVLEDNSNNPNADHSTNSNGCSTKSTDILDGMEYDGYNDSTHTMDTETMSSDVQKKSITKEDDRLLVRILQFGRELHSLKQQLTLDHGDNPQHDKMLQVSFIFYLKFKILSFYFRMHSVY